MTVLKYNDVIKKARTVIIILKCLFMKYIMYVEPQSWLARVKGREKC